MGIVRRSLRLAVFVVVGCAVAAMSSFAQSFTSIASFNLANGFEPEEPLTPGTDGNLYGTTAFGGNLTCNSGSGCGAIFKMTPGGTVTVLHSFSGGDGEAPGALVQATDGNFYGTTPCSSGGAAPSQPERHSHGKTFSRGGSVFFCDGPGSVFKITPSGTLTTLHVFFNDADGDIPSGALTQGSDGNFYGATAVGGTNSEGTIFKITAAGTLTTLYNFCSQPSCTDGSNPNGALLQASDGNFYGTTALGGSTTCAVNGGYGCGSIFKMTPNGTLTTLYRFQYLDGLNPDGGLLQGTDGDIYGATSLGGPNHTCPNDTCGTIFKITPGGTLTTLYNFDGAVDGGQPSPLIQASDGNLYGTTYWGGLLNAGTVFRITTTGILSTLYSFCSEIFQYGCADGEGPGAGLVQGADGLLYGTTSLGGLKNTVNGCNQGVGCGTVFRASGTSSPYQFVPMTPCRLADTRGNPIPGGTTTSFNLPIQAQLWGCGDISSATAYSLNVTVVPHGPLGYLTIWPEGQNQPSVSTLNSPDGRIKANAAIVQAGFFIFRGGVNFYVSDTSDVILDINGYFTSPSAQTLQFYPLMPCRIVDTRNGQGGGTLQAGIERDYPMSGRCGIPATAQAYSLNVTALPTAGGLDYLTVWPQGTPRPNVSTLNDSTGTVVANAAIVAAGANQSVAFYPNSNNTDLLVDVNGYFAPPGPGGNSFYSVPNCRTYDSRDNDGQPFSGQISVTIATSACAPPSAVAGYLFNATVVPSGPMYYLTLWPHGSSQPIASTLNAWDGLTTSNVAIVAASDGEIDAYAAGLTQLVLDISGYFAP